MPVAIITGHGDEDTVVEALRLGATDFLRKPVKLVELKNTLARVLQGRTGGEPKQPPEEARPATPAGSARPFLHPELLGDSAATSQARERIRTAVETDCDTILVTGETGAGKEVVAREIHFQAAEATSPFIAVSCPALPDTLVESELFGHVKGAFTGAVSDRAGCFEQAHGGTLFLDEVGDLSDVAQAKLLRVLETRTVKRVGGADRIPVEVRVVAATNRPLEERIELGQFRQDLFYRLNLFTIPIAPLRERRKDILPLAEHFLFTYATAKGFALDGFSDEAKEQLLAHDFPGNVRELSNVVERAAMLARSGEIKAEHLDVIQDTGEPASKAVRAEQERAEILAALEACGGNRRQAAEKLGMPYSTLRYKIKRLGIR